jgi:hypothetical protein
MKAIILILSIVVLTTSCNSYKPCHVKKYHIDKGIKRAQSKPRNY